MGFRIRRTNSSPNQDVLIPQEQYRADFSESRSFNSKTKTELCFQNRDCLIQTKQSELMFHNQDVLIQKQKLS